MSKNDYEYLDSERKKLWQDVTGLKELFDKLNQNVDNLQSNIITLQEDVSKKTSDYEKDAKSAATQTAKNKTRSATLLKEAQDFHGQIQVLFTQFNTFKESVPEINSLYNSVKDQINELDTLQTKINNDYSIIVEKENAINSSLESAESNLENAENVKNKIDEVKSGIDGLNQKALLAYNLIVKRNIEIRDLYNEIFGYDHKNEESGEDEHVEGLKDELENAYDGFDERISGLSVSVDEIIEQTNRKHKEFLASENKEFDELKNKIRSLLPDAMTAGLSHAYESKRKNEEKNLIIHQKTFNKAIFFLEVSAILPIVISIAFIFTDRSIDQVISSAPRIVVAILPLYLPLFWLAISANKSIKLSKRLIEEYSHKEALSKTFEGLSSQIDNMNNDDMSKDLRTRLLYNIISVSSENPGALIKDFNSSDHPLLDVLNKSMSFKESLEKLSTVPGINLILKQIVHKKQLAEKKIDSAISEAIAADNDLDNEEST